MKKRIISLVIVLAILFSALPVNALAYNAAYKLPTLTGNTGQDIANIATSQLGYTGASGTVYGNWWNGVTNWGVNYTYAGWCAMFACWCANQAGAGFNVAYNKNGASPSLLLDWYKGNATYDTSFSTNPQPGDFLFFGTSGGTPQHVAVVTSYNASTKVVYFVGGNQSSVKGGKVTSSSCSWKKGTNWGGQYIIGYGRPKYSTSATVTFNANYSGGKNTTKTVSPGSKIGDLPKPTRSGYDFVGWYPNANSNYDPITSTTVVNNNVTYYAHWAKPVYTGSKITFDANGGTLGTARNSRSISGYNVFRAVNYLVVFDCDGYKVNTNIYGNDVAVNSSGQVTAKHSYGTDNRVTVPSGGFVLAGQTASGYSSGSFVGEIGIGNYVGYDKSTNKAYVYSDYESYLTNHKYVASGAAYGGLPIPERSGYIFNGWYSASSGGTEVEWDTTLNAKILYARWVKTEAATPAVTYTDIYNNRRYERYDYIMSWEDAKAFCEAKGGHLVTITSAEEQTLVETQLLTNAKKGMYALGASDKAKEGTWTWVTDESFSYNAWDKTAPEPTGGTGENYAYIMAENYAPNKVFGEWIDSENTNYYNSVYSTCNTGFICEYDNVCQHKNTVIINQKPATCTNKGYSGDVLCADCITRISKGNILPMTKHKLVNYKCVNCDYSELKKLDTPVIKATTDASTGAIKLSWNKVANATSYYIYRYNATKGAYYYYDKTTGTSYTNTKTTPGVTYYYKVKAVTTKAGYESSALSAKAYVTRDCSKPVIKLSTIPSSGAIKLQWNSVSGASKYYIYRSTSKNGPYNYYDYTTKTSYTNTKATPGVTYYYKVKAICGKSSYGNSALSSYNYITRDCAKPVLKATNIASTGKIKLSWNAVSGASRYYIYRSTSPNGTYKYYTSTTKTQYTEGSTTPGKVYYYKVKAICGKSSYGNSAASAYASRARDCAQPVVTIGRSSSGKPKLTWKKVDGASKYYIYRYDSSSGSYEYYYSTTGTSFTNTSAKKGYTYYYKVKAICGKSSYGNSALSAKKSIKAK